ncbi:MAG: amidohydrolase [bacterium]|nr:amidohydrolase [bacterium]
MTKRYMLCDLIIKGKYVLPMDDELSIIKDGFVAVSENKICAVGAGDEIKNYQAKEIIDAGKAIVMPGLINCHTHAAMAYFRGLADDLPLNDWLFNHIFPAEAKFVNEEFVRKSGALSCLEMIKSGTTCFNDMYFFGQEFLAEIVEKAGLRAVLGLDLKTPGYTVERVVELAKQFKDNELVKIALAPHSVYVCPRDVLEKVKQAAGAENLRVHIHVSETKKEVEDCKQARGKTPVEYLDELGLLAPATMAAHSVWLDDNDLKIYKDRGVKAAHCPISNMKLASGAAPLAKMLELEIPVGLGTDGAASNNTQDLFMEMRGCALMHKLASLNPAVVSARQAVKMATIDGAKVLGREKEIGSLEIGKEADIITINLNKPHLAPLYDSYSHLVYCAGGSDVENVVVNGRVIMKNRQVKTLDENKILREAERFNLQH